jgi:hypothetical protein
MSFNCFVEDFGVSNLSSSSDGEDAGVVIKSFFSNLISEIDSNLSDLGKDEKNDEKNWKEWRVYSTEYSCLPRIASLKMLKDILLSFGE